MSSENTAARRRESRPEGRRAMHTARIAAAPPGSRQERSLVLAWLQAELAAGADLREVVNLADSMNARHAARRLTQADRRAA